MKKIISLILCAVMLIPAAMPFTVYAKELDRPWKESETVKIIDHTVYELIDNDHWVVRDLFDTAEIKDSQGRTEIVIEETIDGKPVTEIQNVEPIKNQNELKYDQNDYVTDITLPQTLTVICNYAFAGFRALKNVNLPDSLTSIGNQPFYYCSSLEEMTIPCLNGKAFGMSLCTNLKKVTFEGNPESIGSFHSAVNLTEIEIPDSVKKLGSFSNCGLKEITIPNNAEIDNFIGCKKLEKVIYKDAELTDEYVFPKSCFDGCVSLSKIKMPNAKKYILEADSFNGTAFKSFPCKNVTKIGARAFANCKNLKEFTIPASVKSFGREIFKGSKKLRKIYVYSKNKENYKLDNKHYARVFKGLNNKCTIFVNNKTVFKFIKKRVSSYGFKGKVVLIPQIKAPKTLSAKGVKKGAKLSWSKVKGASGYVVYRYDSNKKKYVKVKTVKGKTAVTIKKLNSNEKYKFAVKAYKTKAGTKFYSKYSKAKTVKVK